MKALLITCTMFLFITALHAQTDNRVAMNKTTVNNNGDIQFTNLMHKKVNEFAPVKIAVENKRVVFSGLPAEKKATWAVVTDMYGSYIKGKKVSPIDPGMDIHKLHGLYFVTLVYKNKSKNAFVLNL